MRDENQLHAAVVELVALDDATSSTRPSRTGTRATAKARAAIYNFVTKRGKCLGARSRISWTPGGDGRAITWKYPSCILQGDDAVGEFYSVALTNHHQQADTGTKMIHLGKNTRSTIVSKGISAGQGQQTYRGLVQVNKKATSGAQPHRCDSLLIGNAAERTRSRTWTCATDRRRSSTRRARRGSGKTAVLPAAARLSEEDAVSMIVNGFCRDVFKELPMEFAVEARKLLEVSLEGAVGSQGEW
jgi:Fe-S cluster assembly protein SufB